jgi:outer membrane receptor protein involved in Fe transport
VAQAEREVAGIVTVITRADIQRSGARDLIDVLYYVPGFDFGVDIFGLVGPGVRGLWGTEGKVLLLLDGHEMHDLSYLGTYFGNRVSLDWIERIEVIRGPGTVTYGGAAALAVISITTSRPRDGIVQSAMGAYGQMIDGVVDRGLPVADTFGRRNVSVSAGKTFPELGGLELEVDLFAGQGNRSDRRYRDFDGGSYELAGVNRDDPLAANLAARWRGLEVSYLLERWHTSSQDSYGAISDYPLPIDFSTHSLQAAYTAEVTDRVTLRPSLRYVRQHPWRTEGEREAADDLEWTPVLSRFNAGVTATMRATDWLELLGGGDYRLDESTDDIYEYPDPDTPDPEDTMPTVSYYNVAGYLQGVARTPWVSATAGARYEYHETAGDSFVPRVGLTRTFGPAHVKALYAWAFRAPNIENLGTGAGLVPERTQVIELEAGWRVSREASVAVNAYDTTIENTIAYAYDAEGEGYRNGGQTGTRGAEATFRLRRDGVAGDVGVSYYHAADKNEVDLYRVPGRGDVLPGFAPLKLTATGRVDLPWKLSVSGRSLLLSGRRFGYVAPDAAGEPVVQDYGAELLLDVYVRRSDVGLPGVYAAIGGYNLLEVGHEFIQPYDGGHAPVHGLPMEVLLTVGYDPSL